MTRMSDSSDQVICRNCKCWQPVAELLCQLCGEELPAPTPTEPEPVNAGLLRLVRDYRASIADALQHSEIEHAAAHATLNGGRCEEINKAVFDLKKRLKDIDTVLEPLT